MAVRRGVLAGGLGLAVAPRNASQAAAAPAFGGEAFLAAIREAEHRSGGKLGVAVFDTGTGHRAAWRGDERFPLTSTFKFILAAAVLALVDAGREELDRRLPITQDDLVDHAPVTGKHVGPGGLAIGELCAAILVWSDNPAANLLLPLVGGPTGLTGFARSFGDVAFRLDRFEPALNEAAPGDERDTTTPLAMVQTLDRLLLGEVLSQASRTRLTDWLIGCRTGDEKLRAGLPPNWRCGDKTGGGGHGTSNDIAICWPPGRAPILVTSYLTQTAQPLAARNATLAAVARAVATTV